MYGGTWFYPFHQNVIWTLLIGLSGIHLMEKVRKKAEAVDLFADGGSGHAGWKCAWDGRNGRLLRCRCIDTVYFYFSGEENGGVFPDSFWRFIGST